MASSVLGDWNFITHWADKDKPYPPGTLTFNKDGSVKSDSICGWWIQNEGMLFFLFTDGVYSRTHLHWQCDQ
jgi:hypothetical protein